MSDFFDSFYENPLLQIALVVQYRQNGITQQIIQQILDRNVVDALGCAQSTGIFTELNQYNVMVALMGAFQNIFQCDLQADHVNTTVVLFTDLTQPHYVLSL